MTTFYVDPESGNDASAGTSFGAAWKTIISGATAARIAPGDVIRVKASPLPTLVDSNTTYNQGGTIVCSSAIAKDIEMCEGAWTAVAANVAASFDAGNYKQGTGSAKLLTSGTITAQLLAYKTLAGVTDFSSFQQLSCWYRHASGTLAANNLQIKLCSDTAGATPVNTLTIPIQSDGNVWYPLAIDNGSALGSNIQSVAIYNTANIGSGVTIWLDGIFAALAPGNSAVTLQSLVGKNVATETYYAVRVVNSATITVDLSQSSTMAVNMGYGGATTTTALYKREPFNFTLSNSNSATKAGTDPATGGDYIYYSGGWDRTNMSTQVDESWWSHANIASTLVNGTLQSTFAWVSWDRICAMRTSSGGSVSGTNNKLTNIKCTACSGSVVQVTGNNAIMDTIQATSNNAVGFTFSGQHASIANIVSQSNRSNGFSVAGTFNTVKGTNVASNNFTTGLTLSGFSNKVFNLTTFGNTTSGVGFGAGNENTLINWTGTDSVATSGFANYADLAIRSMDAGGVVGATTVYTDGGTIAIDTTNRRTASGYCWKFSPTSTIRTVNYPLKILLARVKVDANNTGTVKVWIKPDAATVVGGLFVRGGVYSGIASDLTAFTASSGAYEQVVLTFTPTATSVIEVYGTCSDGTGTTNNAYFDDLTVFQT